MTSTLLLSSVVLGCAPSEPTGELADIAYTNGRIYTVNEAQPWAEAVAVQEGRFLVVGSNEDVERVIGEGTEIIDLGGDFVMPGVVDAHVHPYDVYIEGEHGNLLFSDQLDADGIAEAIRVFADANPNRPWIKGMKYGLGAFPGAKMTREWLDEVVPDRPARERYPGQVRRFHMGHNHLVHPDDYARYAELDVVAEVGPALWFPSPVQPAVEERLGAEGATRYLDVRSMLDAGLTVAWGSDWPAGTPDANPFRGLESLVTRAHPSSQFEGTWGEPITLEEGIQLLAMSAAHAMAKEDSIGSIELGKHADFIVLDRNLFEIPPETIYDTKVKRTVFAGRTVHQSD